MYKLAVLLDKHNNKKCLYLLFCFDQEKYCIDIASPLTYSGSI